MSRILIHVNQGDKVQTFSAILQTLLHSYGEKKNLWVGFRHPLDGTAEHSDKQTMPLFSWHGLYACIIQVPS